jgi:hypothetical protein
VARHGDERPANDAAIAVRITVEVNFHIDTLLRSDFLRDEIGDLGIKSDVIAYNHDALDILKRKGPRKYYELTLDKGAEPLSISKQEGVCLTLQLGRLVAQPLWLWHMPLPDWPASPSHAPSVKHPVVKWQGKS